MLGVLITTLVILWLGRLARPFPPSGDARAGRPSHVYFKAAVAIIIVAAIVGPWMYLVEHRAPGFLRTTTSHDVIQRVFEPLEQHSGPPGYYLLLVWGIFFPWSVLLPVTFVIAWRHRDDPRVRFALSAVIGPWLMFEAVQTKLPHYLLPTFPPLAYLMADAIVRCLHGEHDDLTTAGTRGAIATWAVIAAALGFLPVLAYLKVPMPPTACAVVGVLYGGCVAYFFFARRPRGGLIGMGAGMMLVMLIAYAWYLPAAQDLRLSIDIAKLLTDNGAGKQTQPGDVQMIGYKEPSLAFYQGGTIREQGENDFLTTHPPGEWPKWLVIREDVWAKMPAEIQQKWDVIGSCKGIVIADKGRTWMVHVLQKKLVVTN